MKFFADHCVSESVCRVLEERGHTVVRLRDELLTDSPDPVVAKFAEEIEAILVSHDRDFKKIAPRIPAQARSRFKRLSRVHLQCDYPGAEKRVAAAMSLLEFEWAISQERPDRRIHIVIQKNGIKTYR
jgi:hypothetical protein